MVVQARAEATRRRIIESAVDLFDELGYGETGLADVLQRAGVSKGAFYYHFDSKEALAAAIIDQYRHQNAQRVAEAIDTGAPLLERIIVATFVSAAMMESETPARIANQLVQALGQVSSTATQVYSEWTTAFTRNLTEALKGVGTRDGVEAADVAEAMWAAVLGCHLLSAALDGAPQSRLARAWRTMVLSTIAEPAQSHYDEVLDRLAGQPQAVG